MTCQGLQLPKAQTCTQNRPDMGILCTLLARLKLSATDAAIIAVVVVAALNVLAEFWAWLGSPP